MLGPIILVGLNLEDFLVSLLETTTVNSNAKFVGTYIMLELFNGYLTGWARFCSPASNPDSCLGSLTSDKNGGWDGWISLKGKTTAGC